jgi:hypothetical protein
MVRFLARTTYAGQKWRLMRGDLGGLFVESPMGAKFDASVTPGGWVVLANDEDYESVPSEVLTGLCEALLEGMEHDRHEPGGDL